MRESDSKKRINSRLNDRAEYSTSTAGGRPERPQTGGAPKRVGSGHNKSQSKGKGIENISNQRISQGQLSGGSNNRWLGGVKNLEAYLQRLKDKNTMSN